MIKLWRKIMARLIKTATPKGAARNAAILRERGKSPAQAKAVSKSKMRQVQAKRGK